MARRRRREEQDIFALALKSGWQFSAALAGVCAVGALAVIHAVFGHSPLLRPFGSVLAPLAWILAGIFALIALFRFSRPGEVEALRVDPSKSSPVREEPSAFDQIFGDVFGATKTAARGSPTSTGPAAPSRPTTIDVAWGTIGNRTEPTVRPTAWSQEVLDQVEWKRFEDLCCAFYREKGIRAETTRLGADGGIDIRLFQDEAAPERMTAVVQCKAWNQRVGVKEIRELRGVMAHEKVEKAFFMAPQGFTDDARAFAQANRITLLDGKLFLAMIQRLPAESGQRLLDFATEGAWTTPTCPSCGTKMVAKESKRGPFWACPSFPRCRGKLPMRAHDAATR